MSLQRTTFTAKDAMNILAFIAMAGSALWHFEIQRQLSDHLPIIFAFSAILTLAPPTLTAFMIPWSPAGMLLQKVGYRTVGFWIALLCTAILIYYTFELQYSWWAAQNATQDAGLVWQQVIIGIIGFILIPALLWTPVRTDELTETVRQAHLVRRYELQTEADIAILRAQLLNAQAKSLIGLADLTVGERRELASAMRGLVVGIDQTLNSIGHSVNAMGGALQQYDALDDNQDIREYLGYVATSVSDTPVSQVMTKARQQQPHR